MKIRINRDSSFFGFRWVVVICWDSIALRSFILGDNFYSLSWMEMWKTWGDSCLGSFSWALY